MGPETAQSLIAAAHARGLHAVVRVPEATRSAIQDALDGGADGILVPGVESGEVAAQIASWCRYPPVGSRGMHGLTAGSDHARIGGPALAGWANDRVAVMVQVETRRGLEEVAAIATAPGVDLVFHGPSDLAVSLGIERGSPEARAAMTRIVEAARAAKVGFGTFAFTEADGREAIAVGAQLVIGGGDVGFVLGGAGALAGALRTAGAVG
jgi:4-hydroxy-2-oxoheptanedioate aldolase